MSGHRVRALEGFRVFGWITFELCFVCLQQYLLCANVWQMIAKSMLPVSRIGF